MRSVAAPYVPSAAWRASLDDGTLVVSAGADLVLADESLDVQSAQQLINGWRDGQIDVEQLSHDARKTLQQLEAAGAIGRSREPERATTVAVRFAGIRDTHLERRLRHDLDESPTLHQVEGEPDLVLVVRTTARLVELYEPSGPEDIPHLLLDLAYHHTVSLGPLVVPGETACLGCLAGRIGAVWGDAPPPARPAALASSPLAAALAVRELETIGAGDLRLANATVAYDVAAHRVTSCPAYRLPWCPVCGDGAAAPRGDLELPWARTA